MPSSIGLAHILQSFFRKVKYYEWRMRTIYALVPLRIEGVFCKSNSVTRQSNTPKGRFLAENMIKYVQKERRCFYGVFRKIKRTA